MYMYMYIRLIYYHYSKRYIDQWVMEVRYSFTYVMLLIHKSFGLTTDDMFTAKHHSGIKGMRPKHSINFAQFG